MNNDNVFFDFVNLNFYPEFVYFLGFCWADGSVYDTGYHNKISIEINSTDAVIIKPILEKIGLWKITKRKRNIKPILGRIVNAQESTRFRINNKCLTNFLVKYGYKNKSGSHNQILSIIPENLHEHFFRGLIDGDGHVSICETSQGYKSMSIVTSGPIDQDWSAFSDFCMKRNISYRIRTENKSSKYSVFIVNKKKDLLKFINLIFKPEYNYLERKYSKAIEIATEILKKPKYSSP